MNTGVKKVRLAFIGFGNVPQAVLRYMKESAPTQELRRLKKEIVVTGVADIRGHAISEKGFSTDELLMAAKAGTLASLNKGKKTENNIDFLKNVPADIVFVATPAFVPSVEEITTAFSLGMDVVTSNKNPVANSWREIAIAAKKYKKEFRFGATVLAGFPPWRQWFDAITPPDIQEIQIVVNATSNQILTMMLEDGKSFDEGVKKAQAEKIAEADPSDDIEGRDTQKKLAIIANVLMDAGIAPADIPTEGIREVTIDGLRNADRNGKWIHLLGRAWRGEDGKVRGEVKPVETDNPFFTRMRGKSMGLYFVTSASNFGIRLDLGEGERALRATAAGVFEDILTLAKKM
ncbi:MAG: hypothetical protein HYT94_03675 [Parcubacteria group bacterium]|nr:hypothetical protein [Parcubacteria group bacterium]